MLVGVLKKMKSSISNKMSIWVKRIKSYTASLIKRAVNINPLPFCRRMFEAFGKSKLAGWMNAHRWMTAVCGVVILSALTTGVYFSTREQGLDASVMLTPAVKVEAEERDSSFTVSRGTDQGQSTAQNRDMSGDTEASITSGAALSEDPSGELGTNSVNDSTAVLDKPELHGMVVCVDAGHGGIDGGCSYDNAVEKDFNLDIALRLGKLLELTGIEVVYTRQEDVFVNLKKRSAIANEAKADLFISVHNNAMDDGGVEEGTETLYGNSKRYGGGDVMDDKKLASIIQEEMTKLLDTRDRGTVYRPRLAVLSGTRMPSIIAEVAFLSNAKDRAKLNDPDFRQSAAKALYNGVIRALEEMRKS